MKTLTTAFSTATVLAALFAAAAPAHADAGYDQYRRVVLGDSTIAAPAGQVATRTELVAGPYAQYLITNGSPKGQAIATAARIGEKASYGTVAVDAPQRVLTPAQAYAKYLGNDGLGTRKNESVGSAE